MANNYIIIHVVIIKYIEIYIPVPKQKKAS